MPVLTTKGIAGEGWTGTGTGIGFTLIWGFAGFAVISFIPTWLFIIWGWFKFCADVIWFSFYLSSSLSDSLTVVILYINIFLMIL